jgi:capsular polysaccharide biosynthesis protein
VAIAAGDAALGEELYRLATSKTSYGRPLKISPAATLGEWCTRAGAVYRQIDAPCEVNIPATTYAPGHVYTTEPVEYAVLAQGLIAGGWDFAIAPDGTVLTDTSYQAPDISMAPYAHFYAPMFGQIMHHMPEKEEFVAGDVIRLSAPHALHFGHWLVDFLPRLRALDISGNSSAKVAVPHDIPPKFRQMLMRWGLSDDRLVLCRRDTRYRFERLHVLRPGQSLPPNPVHVRYVRERLYTPAPPLRKGEGVKVYAARGGGLSRTIDNWSEVQAFLDQEGFVEVDFAPLSVDDQRALMADAEVLLGVFGSNLFALYFAPPTCTMITILPEGLEDVCMTHTCTVIGIGHQHFVCPATNAGTKRQLKDTHFRLDLATLRMRLRALEAGQ